MKKSIVSLKKLDMQSSSSELLLACQASLREVVLGVLDVTFPAEEGLAAEGFPDDAVVETANRNLDLVVDWAHALERLFTQSSVEPAAAPIQSAETLPAEILEMLTNATASGRSSGTSKSDEKTESKHIESKQRWQVEEGRLGKLLDSEIWEAAETLQNAYEALRLMLRAQGPVKADHDSPAAWGPMKDTEETSRLLHHGIYSSTHLLGLKQQAELVYWLWLFHGPTWKAQAERTLREFVHIVEDIIPDRGWTAEWEKQRVKELESAASTSGGAGEEKEALQVGHGIGAGSSSTMKVLEEEFGSMDVQQEIDRMKKEDDSEEKNKKNKQTKRKQNKKKK
ncbi:hypothetical protein CYMTET_50080 [Cymbomonas tetramitiformis]|uniref:Uncharacterized protein n=1 Tax=Cymbomonas tetramitiformis TaxID=36881 RepID=A0AAE0BNW8_9CHLO|nr:hypothetical protein CYMTET_50080 [Cymbomonas tetramitiformis]|eukprot:gene2930-3744_t